MFAMHLLAFAIQPHSETTLMNIQRGRLIALFPEKFFQVRNPGTMFCTGKEQG